MGSKSEFDSFEKAMQSSIRGAAVTPSDELWQRVESSLDGGAAIWSLSRVVKWASVVAAAAVIAICANVWYAGEVTRESYFEDFVKIGNFEKLSSAVIDASPEMSHMARFNKIVEEEIFEQSEEFVLDNLSDVESVSDDEEELVEAADAVEKQPFVVEENQSREVEVSRDVRIKREQHPVLISMTMGGGRASSVAGQDFVSAPYMASGSSQTYVNLMDTRNYKPSDVNHMAPLSFALNLNYPLSKRWSVESGLNYTILQSNLKMPYEAGVLTQKVEFVGVPLRVDYKVLSSASLSMYVGSGLLLERCVSAKLNSHVVDERDWHSSVGAVVGMQYNVLDWLALYAEPEMNYYFTQTKLSTVRNESPFSFNLRFGLRFIISR